MAEVGTHAKSWVHTTSKVIVKRKHNQVWGEVWSRTFSECPGFSQVTKVGVANDMKPRDTSWDYIWFSAEVLPLLIYHVELAVERRESFHVWKFPSEQGDSLCLMVRVRPSGRIDSVAIVEDTPGRRENICVWDLTLTGLKELRKLVNEDQSWNFDNTWGRGELNEFCRGAHKNATAAGWWADRGKMRTGLAIAMIASESFEMVEEYRRENDPVRMRQEAADVLVRLADVCGALEIDLELGLKEVQAKLKTRADHRPEVLASETGKSF